MLTPERAMAEAKVIRLWVNLNTLMGDDRDVRRRLTVDGWEKLLRWRKVFADEIDLVHRGYNTIVNAVPLSDEDAIALAVIAEKLWGYTGGFVQ